MTSTGQSPSRTTLGALTGVGMLIGVVVAVLTSEVILGVIAGASFIAISVGLVRLWTGGETRHPRHP